MTLPMQCPRFLENGACKQSAANSKTETSDERNPSSEDIDEIQKEIEATDRKRFPESDWDVSATFFRRKT